MPLTRSLLSSLVPLLALTLATPRPADACTCAHVSPFLSPAPGACEVPRNTIVAAQLYGTPPEALQLIETATGATVAMDVELHDPSARLLIARPRELLAPATEYQATFGPDDRMTFVTSEHIDSDSPAFPGLAALHATSMLLSDTCYDTCTVLSQNGRYNAIELAFADPGSDVAFLTLALRRDGEDAVFYTATLPRRSGVFINRIGAHLCDPAHAPALEPGRSYCGTLTAYDAAGNISGQEVEVCSAPASAYMDGVPAFCWGDDSCEEPAGFQASGLPAALHSPQQSWQVDARCVPVAPVGSAGCTAQSQPLRGWAVALLGALALLSLSLSRRRGRPAGPRRGHGPAPATRATR